MTIGILETGNPPATLQSRYGGYGDMVRGMLAGSHDVQVFDVQAGVLPRAPEECAGYVVTGSAAGAYDDLAWIAPLSDFLCRARGRARLAGICFGHQVMAQAFGGRVEKSAKGWGLGLHRYSVVERTGWMDDAATVALPAFHQDQVVALPPDAVVLARNAFTPFAALRYGVDAMSVQAHPEFDARFSVALVEATRARYGDAADPAIRSYDAPNDSARVGGWISRFLSGVGQTLP